MRLIEPIRKQGGFRATLLHGNGRGLLATAPVLVEENIFRSNNGWAIRCLEALVVGNSLGRSRKRVPCRGIQLDPGSEALSNVLEAGGALGNAVGRLGHGLGSELTEPPSHAAFDDTVLTPGMVITLEPGMEFAPGRNMVHEENLVIREHGAQLLSRRAAPEIPIIG